MNAFWPGSRRSAIASTRQSPLWKRCDLRNLVDRGKELKRTRNDLEIRTDLMVEAPKAKYESAIAEMKPRSSPSLQRQSE